MIIKTCSKYILRQINAIFIAVLLILIAMVWLTKSLKLIDLITSKGLDILSFVKITGMLITPLSYTIIPIALLIATVLTISRLSNDRELVVLRSAGLSNFQITKPMLIYAAIIMILNYSISAYFLPKSTRAFKDMQDVFKSKYVSLFLEEGVFNSQMNSFTVYIAKKESDTKFKGIFIYDQRDTQKPVTLTAKSGTVARTNIGPEFVLLDGTHQQEDKATGHVSLVMFDKYRFSLSLFSDEVFMRAHNASERYIHQLLFPEGGESAPKEFFIHGIQRLIWPLYCVILVMISAGVMLSGHYSRRNSVIKNLTASIISGVVVILSLIFNNLALKTESFIVLMYANVLISFGFGVWLLKEHRTINFITKIEAFFHAISFKKS